MKALIALEDGKIFNARSFTGPGEATGEVIFNTGMTGYQEILTDPSYTGQMVTMTYPLIGNYGINPEDVESKQVYAQALIVKECCKVPSNWRSTITLPDYLKENGCLGVEGVDTRALTRHIRLQGAMRAVISTEVKNPQDLVEKAKAIPTMEGLNLGEKVSTTTAYAWSDGGPKNVDLSQGYDWPKDEKSLVVYDFGAKWNILRILKSKGFHPLVVPASTTADEVKRLAPKAVFLSNGPGDPAALPGVVNEVKQLLDTFPVAGICLGHQLLGLALGGKTYKLKFGHHGCNHPVLDKETGKIEISSQNHGFCVDISGMDELETTHINLNDNTLEGFKHKTKPIIAIQHHPEAAPGPRDCQSFFNKFKTLV